jgi:hypothetical protein
MIEEIFNGPKTDVFELSSALRANAFEKAQWCLKRPQTLPDGKAFGGE